MPIFEYQGRDQTGKPVSGEGIAQSAENLSAQLFSRNITPISITLKKQQEQSWKNVLGSFQRKKVSNTELSLFTRQMYILIKSGVPIISAIKQMAENSRSKYFTQVLYDVLGYLEAGQNLSVSMQHYPDVFSPLVIGMIHTGESSGRLDEVFLHLTDYLELEGSTIKRVKSAIRYPSFVLGAIIVGVIIINIFVVPVFAKVFLRSNIPLPTVTLLLIKISNFFIEYWPYLLILFISIVITLSRYLKTPQGRLKWNKYQLRIPVIGVLLKRIILLRFAQTFAIVANSGISILEGLVLVGQSMTNQYARSEIVAMRDSIQHGNSILQAASACPLFSSIELQMLSVAEETGDLGPMLTSIASYHQREVDYDIKRLTDMMEPLLLIAIAFMVLLLALAVYMPIWNMIKMAHH
jgi:MSHA biogenesis protein MshG